MIFPRKINNFFFFPQNAQILQGIAVWPKCSSCVDIIILRRSAADHVKHPPSGRKMTSPSLPYKCQREGGVVVLSDKLRLGFKGAVSSWGWASKGNLSGDECLIWYYLEAHSTGSPGTFSSRSRGLQWVNSALVVQQYHHILLCYAITFWLKWLNSVMVVQQNHHIILWYATT